MIEIPLTSSPPHQEFEIGLGGDIFRLQLDYNDRDTSWYITLASADGATLIAGKRLAVDWQPFAQYSQEEFPAGLVFTVDESGQGNEAGQTDLGVVLKMFFATDAEVAVAAAL